MVSIGLLSGAFYAGLRYVQSISKPKHSNLKESPEVGPRKHVKPANGIPLTGSRLFGCSEISKL